jgi:two-component system NarL family sensor kinase
MPSLSPEVRPIVVEHALRGISLQVWLRGALVVFVLFTLALVPPSSGLVACWVIAVLYALVAIGVAIWTRRGGVGPVRYAWLALYTDVAALSALSMLTGVAAPDSWTADTLQRGFFIIPLLAATQLRPWVCLSVVAPTTACYLAVCIVTQGANDEPSRALLLRSFVIACMSVAAVWLSAIQRSRVLTIGQLADDRSALLAELMGIEERERRSLAENLHDGALQYVLGARLDLEDLREGDSSDALNRLDEALSESSRLLRSTVTELHPAVLEQSGLPRALESLVAALAPRAGLAASLDVDEWPVEARTPLDMLLFTCARELVTNVVKHARAERLDVRLALRGDRAELVVEDDGVGMADGIVASRLAQGHIGLESHRIRLEAADGHLVLTPRPAGGTIATVDLPVRSPVAAALA